MKEDEEKIREELSKVGIYVDSIYDLVNNKKPYPQAIPVLILLLKKGDISNCRIREGIIRSLAVKEAKGKANAVLINEYKRTPIEQQSLRWSIGNSIRVLITDKDIEDVLEIVRNKENGSSRQMFVLALGKFKSEIVEDTLIQLLNDEEVTVHALNALRKLRSKNAKKRIAELTSHPNTIIRNLAREFSETI